MRLSSSHAGGWLVLSALVTGLTLGGCPVPTSSTTSETKNNGSFQTATPIDLAAMSDVTEFAGALDATDKVDMYNLGTLERGDRVVVDVRTTSGSLDPVAAIFDAKQDVHAFNDDRVADASDLNPRMDIVIRGPQQEYFLGVAPFPGSDTTGTYRVSITVTRGVGGADAVSQTVFLDFDGGQNVEIDNVGVFDLAPFDSLEVGPFPGQSATLKKRIVAVVKDRFDGFALTLLNSDDDPVPAGPHSTVYFGGSSLSAFAISEHLDILNADQGDDAIIFTRSFRGAFSTTPTLDQVATAIGNTVAHEIGHLLGLVHTRDCSSLMDTTCGNDSLLVEQAFKLAPLDDSVFPLGSQDAHELIGWIIGFAGM